MNPTVVVTGNGRSGTNWVLDILNASPSTHCRNEPHRIETSPLHPLATNWTEPAGAPPIIDLWDSALAWSAARIGERGPEIVTTKNFVRGTHSLSNFLLNAPLHPRQRALLQRLDRRYVNQEWTPPTWLISAEALQRATTVLKIINIDPRNIVWLFEQHPTLPVLHVVRHPGGRLHSWNTRFRSHESDSALLERNKTRLRHVTSIAPQWRLVFGNIDEVSLSLSELFLWRYLNETIIEAASTAPNGSVFVYEELVAAPQEGARAVYQASGVPWDDATKDVVTSRLGTSVWGDLSQSPAETASRWREQLSEQDVEDVERVMSTSPLATLWEPKADDAVA